MVIGICGGSGSGKTTLLKRLCNYYDHLNPSVFVMDNYYHPIEMQKKDELGYYNYWFSAQKKGYSGVGILSKIKPNNIEYGTGIDYMDFEGRNLRLDFDKFSLMSLYLPSGTNIDRLGFKFKYMDLSLIHI